MENWFGSEEPVRVHCKLKDIDTFVFFQIEENDGRLYSREDFFKGCDQMSGCPQCEACRKEAYQRLLSGSC